MTLRLRLVAGLVVLMTAGLAIFGGTMYGLYSHSQYNDLQSQLKNSVGLVAQELAQQAHVDLNGGTGTHQVPSGGVVGGPPGPYGGDGAGDGGQGPGHPPIVVAPGTFGELLSPTGTVLTSLVEETGTSAPNIPASLVNGRSDRFVHVGSVKGSTTWLAYISPRSASRDRVVVAVPTTSVTNSLHRLVLIEVTGAIGLLLLLSVGAGLVLRRGLAPLESMAGTARQISAGDLAQRVPGPGQRTEVGELAGAFNTMLDEIQAAFAQRDATEERLRQFLADASHELRTPLTSIQGFAELSRLGSDSPHIDTATIMRRIEEEAARMRGLVEDLLLLARLDQVRPGQRAPVDLSVLAADACSDAVAADPTRPVTLTAPEPVVVLGDEAHLRQALANLVANALRHTPPGTALEVSARLAGRLALLEVRDHGPGLDQQAMAHAFERFWQKDTARSGSGAGLGLSIVAAVAAEHGGQASVANAEGGGAIFTLRLPLVRGAEALVDKPPPPAQAARPAHAPKAGATALPAQGPLRPGGRRIV